MSEQPKQDGERAPKERDYQPGSAERARVEGGDKAWTLVFVRELRHSPSKVWRALTDPDELREWAPFDASRELGATGPVTLSMAGGAEPMPLEGAVIVADPPVLLEYTWGDDRLRWELEPTATGTRLTLRHTLEHRDWVPKVTAGWHICLDVAERALDGHPVGRIVADDARRFGWERLNVEYAAAFGIEATA
jgi:uncharacterized protein YndB with AHSA1/START domain